MFINKTQPGGLLPSTGTNRSHNIPTFSIVYMPERDTKVVYTFHVFKLKYFCPYTTQPCHSSHTCFWPLNVP